MDRRRHDCRHAQRLGGGGHAPGEAGGEERHRLEAARRTFELYIPVGVRHSEFGKCHAVNLDDCGSDTCPARDSGLGSIFHVFLLPIPDRRQDRSTAGQVGPFYMYMFT